MKRIDWALSNEVFVDENYVYKNIVFNDFKKLMSHNEIDILRVYDPLELIEGSKDKVVTSIVKGEPKVIYSEDELIGIANEIKNLHKINIDNKELTNFKEAYEFLGGKKDIKDVLTILERNPVLLHNDLVEGNILIDGDNATLIDFEYSAYGNEIFDIASFITERKLLEGQEEFFVSQFDVDLKELEIVKDFLNEFWGLWADYMYELSRKEIYKTISKWKKEQL